MSGDWCKNCGGEGWLPSTPIGKDSTCPACKGTGRERKMRRHHTHAWLTKALGDGSLVEVCESCGATRTIQGPS